MSEVLEEWLSMPLSAVVDDIYGGSLTLAMIMEAPADSAIRSGFRNIIRRSKEFTATEAGWGLPDLEAARELIGMNFAEFAHTFELDYDFLAMLEMGWGCPTLSSLLDMADHLKWPLGIFYRDVTGHLHHLTRLSREYGFKGRRK